jgi:hypothetical protein
MRENVESERSDLYLLRLWTGGAEGPAGERSGESAGMDGWQHGRLLNVLDGEGHNFDSWEGLVGILRKTLTGSDEASR